MRTLFAVFCVATALAAPTAKLLDESKATTAEVVVRGTLQPDPAGPLTISPDFKAKIPNVVVGWITATVRKSQHDEGLWREIEATANCFKNVTMQTERRMSLIKALRDAYRALSNDPTRSCGSNEAQVRRISQGKDLYRVNNVDVNNLISLETLHSAGTFDRDRLQPPIIFRVGQPGEIGDNPPVVATETATPPNRSRFGRVRKRNPVLTAARK